MKQGLLITILLLTALFTVQIYACECCAERYTTHGGSFSSELMDSDMKLLQSLHFNGSMGLHISQRDPIVPIPKVFVKGSISTDTLFLDCFNENKSVGQAFIILPKEMQEMRTDTRLIFPKVTSKKTVLYKEARFDGELEISRELLRFLGVPINKRVRLVLHANGDKCWKAEQFHSWTLHFDYEYDGFQLAGFGYGELKTGKPFAKRKSAPPNLSAGTDTSTDKQLASAKSTSKKSVNSVRTVSTMGKKYHVVEPGQTVYRIAIIYKLKVEDVARWNNIAPPNYIVKIGQKILLEPPGN